MVSVLIRPAILSSVFLFLVSVCLGDEVDLMREHCAGCHGGKDPKGDFDLQSLGDAPSEDSLDYWTGSLDYVRAGEMPPGKHNKLSEVERQAITGYLEAAIARFEAESNPREATLPRRLNNREFEHCIADALLIEDIGTHQPTAMLLGDTLEDGFDTNGRALGMSEYHLDQYVTAVRKILDATIFSGERL